MATPEIAKGLVESAKTAQLIRTRLQAESEALAKEREKERQLNAANQAIRQRPGNA